MKIKYYSEFILNEGNAIDNDNIFYKEVKKQLTFQYKVRKNKYIKVKEATGNIADNDIDIDIKLSNKDEIDLKYQNGNLKIKINGELIYDLDDINYGDIIISTKQIYDKYLEQQGKSVIRKKNPFK